MRWWHRLVLAAATGSILLLVTTSLYVLWPGDGTNHFWMLGRDLLPAAPLVVLASSRRPRREPPALGLAVTLGLARLLITAVVWERMIGRSYG